MTTTNGNLFKAEKGAELMLQGGGESIIALADNVSLRDCDMRHGKVHRLYHRGVGLRHQSNKVLLSCLSR